MKRLLKKHKGLLLRVVLYPLAAYAGYQGLNLVEKKMDDQLALGCTKAMQLTVNPLIFPQCLVRDGKLLVKVITGQVFDVETGEAVSE